MYVGGLEHVRKVIFHKCNYMEDDAMDHINHLKKSLNSLQVSSCGNISDVGLCSLIELRY